MFPKKINSPIIINQLDFYYQQNCKNSWKTELWFPHKCVFLKRKKNLDKIIKNLLCQIFITTMKFNFRLRMKR